MKQSIFTKITALFITAAIVLTTLVFAFAASFETEGNNTIETANVILVNNTVTGSVSAYSDLDWYKFTIPVDGKVNINFKHAQGEADTYPYWNIYLYQYNSDTLAKTVIMSFESYMQNSSTNSANIGLSAGTYYILISAYHSNYHSDIDYILTTSFTKSQYWEKEFNDSMETSNVIPLNTAFSGSTNAYTDSDWYKFTITDAGKVRINFKHAQGESDVYPYWNIYLYQYNPDTLAKTVMMSFNSYLQDSSTSSANIGLPAGTYYILTSAYHSNYHSDIDYILTAFFTKSLYWEKEFNDSMETSNAISLNTTFSGSTNDYSDSDWYKFIIPKAGKVCVNFKHAQGESDVYPYWNIYLYQYNPDTFAKTIIMSFNSYLQDSSTDSAIIGLPAGTYYILVSAYHSNYHTDIDYMVTVLTPVAPSIPKSPKATSASYNSIKINWSAVSGASGYAIYRYNSSTKGYDCIKVTSATSFTDTERTTGKTYNYKIKAYKKFFSTNIYSASTSAVSAKPIPATPASFTTARASSSSIKTSWSAVAGATGYAVYRYNASTKAYDKIKVTTSTSFTNTGLVKGTTYTYKVIAYRTVSGVNIYGLYSVIKSAKPY